MMATVDAVHVFAPGTISKESMSKSAIEGRKRIYAEYRKQCGPDGMEINAFATVVNDERVVYLCPGWVIASTDPDDPEGRIEDLNHLLGHELGHHLDFSTEFGSVYAKQFICLSENYGAACEGRVNPNPNAPGNGGCLNDAREGTYPAARIGVHSREITADYWGVQSLIEELRGVSPYKYLKVMQENWGTLCCTDDEGSHPSGRYRIEVMLRWDPEIHRMMGCQVPASGATIGCTLDGPTTQPMF
jgi:hypothetical protein